MKLNYTITRETNVKRPNFKLGRLERTSFSGNTFYNEIQTGVQTEVMILLQKPNY